MTFTEFMSILNGEYKEVAGTTAKNQCVDLANAYIKYVLGLPIIEWTNAVDFPSKAGGDYEFILNTPTGVPVEGDLIIWKPSPGHIAIFIEGTATRFTSFDENFPTGSPCHVQEHSYTNVVGWLHPKVSPATNQTLIDQLRADRDRNWGLYEQEKQAKIQLEDTVAAKQKSIDELTKENLSLKGERDQLVFDKEVLAKQVDSLTKDLDAAKNSKEECEALMGNRKTLSQYKTGELFKELFDRLIKI